MKKEDDKRRGKEDATGRTKRSQLRIFGLRTLPASRFGLRRAACCPCAVGQMGKERTDRPGAYLENSVVANEKVAAHSSDLVIAEKLWNVTEKLIGETFAF
ncbi:hypothetical protein B0H19DRAFT_1065611 [Mycena capillaripes]|nr:hypothetical protein B0H19DRAFT_1065611 [Mycena capillaripes]